MEALRDAAGNVVETDTCACRRPKYASAAACCETCTGEPHTSPGHVRESGSGALRESAGEWLNTFQENER